MKVAYGSDLHLEFGTIELNNTENSDLLILSGDILIAEDIYRHPDPMADFKKQLEKLPGLLWKPSDNQKRSMIYHEFLNNVSNQFPKVIMILGNHEYYNGKFPDAVQWLKEYVVQFPNISVLEKEKIEIEGITFIGGTLWTNLNNDNPITASVLGNSMNDYSLIRNSTYGYRRLIPIDTLKDHKKFLEYIKNVVESEPEKPYVVCGHHAPTTLSIHEKYKTEKDFHDNGGYASDLSNFILDHPQIKIWIHGHTHENFDYMMGSTRVLCNPRGYIAHEPNAINFRLKYFEI